MSTFRQHNYVNINFVIMLDIYCYLSGADSRGSVFERIGYVTNSQSSPVTTRRSVGSSSIKDRLGVSSAVSKLAVTVLHEIVQQATSCQNKKVHIANKVTWV